MSKEHIPKVGNTDRESIMGLPKGSNTYGDGVPILGNKEDEVFYYLSGTAFLLNIYRCCAL